MKNHNKVSTIISFLFILFLFIVLVLQYHEYRRFRTAFETIKIVRNYYTQCQDCSEEQLLTRNHRYFIIRFLDKTELSLNDLKVVTNPKFNTQLENRMTISDIFTHFTDSEARPLIKKIKSEIAKNIGKSDEFITNYLKYLQGQLNINGPVILRTGELLEANMHYEVKLEPTKFNLFVLILKLPKVNFEFDTNTDTTDQDVYEKIKFENIVNQYIMMHNFTLSQELQNERCPYKFGFALNHTEYYSLVEGSKCDPSKIGQIEEISVEIYTQNLEEGKQKFREISLAPIGLSEGPRLRVNYIHKPGGYISPTPKK